jgi:hypothetical protein
MPLDVLDVELAHNDAGVQTVRDYLRALLLTLWREEEGFSGKRPFGNSGWKYELYKPLIEDGFVEGKLDDCGCVEEVNEREADALIEGAIDRIFNAS